MSSNGDTSRLSIRRWIAAGILLSTSVWWMLPDALGQEVAATALNTTAHSTLWSLETRGPGTTPYLVIGMAERGESPSYRLLRLPRDEAANPSPRDTISPPVGPAASVNSAEERESGPQLLSRFFAPAARVRASASFPGKGAIRPETIQSSPQPGDTNVYSLLDDGPAPGSFLYGYRLSYLPPKPWLTDNEFVSHEIAQAPRPLLQFEFSGWALPVMLSGAPISR